VVAVSPELELTDWEITQSKMHVVKDAAEQLKGWYRELPERVRTARADYRLVSDQQARGSRRMAKKALENILADPYGVVIFSDPIALNLRLGELLTRQPAPPAIASVC
jgi:hypothetical protein